MASNLQSYPPNTIELGWLIINELESVEEISISQGRAQMLQYLQQHFPQFEWRMPVIKRTEQPHGTLEAPTDLLQKGEHEREIRRWDYAFVVTRADLKSYYKPYALAIPSRAINVAVLSTARLAFHLDDDKNNTVMAQQIFALGMHLLGDLNDLPHRDDPKGFMYPPRIIRDLDGMTSYSQKEQEQLAEAFAEVGDIRLEEQFQTGKTRPWLFYLKVLGRSRGDIASAVIQAKPWEFPFRLSRLTAAAISTLLVLIITAEVWELGMSQPPLLVTGLSLLALTGTSLFILKRQQLLLHRGKRPLTEQTVITNLAITTVVVLGMTTTYLMLFLLVLLLGKVFYNPVLLQGWAASLESHIYLRHYLVLSGFIASLGIMIGSLGASFEGQRYFRHVTYVDEEI
ncbi:conserved hypothetical protein [Nitrosococcus oceani ATCC 19707]|uniref:Uncharacterized protein n=2 Tax=Nitrosococcus oceani TaxID=1229 RepID=Q3J763_NITOC|nr:hypothetical protein [Nitrosococcus oceani]ABA59333.1 conserved hypothetical protein [Nitrosococcus oceani ATCC 19707]EDZ65744.1 hypothetical protein NOC27_2424 [Nitrosococcus oceani AFC27]KFI18219.1 hypothetical protein IB75_15310 [Nitrosococcus oceani C-27]GEM20098.1 hypothetical protein NONS58_15050 [Nitrosococcus oceani]